MDLKKLNPWNWFKHEEAGSRDAVLPVQRDSALPGTPFTSGSIWQLHREMDRLFDETLRQFGLPSRLGSGLTENSLGSFVPRLNVASNDQGYSITLEAPGLEQDDIKLDLRDHTLYIRGEKRQEKEEQDQQYYRIERHYGQFQRVLELPADVDLDKISAHMKNGVLTLTLPRTAVEESTRQRSIQINRD